tara:strand:+ start:186 stop:380 length:195 start_codon:yes stop_codon:yes gene_type:complete
MGILKKQLDSTLGLKGETPATREGALPTSEIHAQGVGPTSLKANHSVHDLDGKTPDKYLDNKPE